MNDHVQRISEARAILDEKQTKAYAALKEAKTQAKQVRDEAKKNAPDKATKKRADELYKETVREVEAECSRIVSMALEEWRQAYEDIEASRKEATKLER